MTTHPSPDSLPPEERPILSIGPIGRPQPQPALIRPRPSLARRGLVVALLAASPVAAVAVVAVLVLCWLWVQPPGAAGRWALGLAALALGALAVGTVRAVRRTPDPSMVSLADVDEPELHAFVASLASELGVRAPQRIAVAASARVDLRTAEDGWPRRRGGQTLVLGAPLLDALTVTELRALVAGILAQQVRVEGRLGPFLTCSGLSGDDLLARASTPTRVALGWYLSLRRRLETPVVQRQAVLSQREAVRVVGVDATISAWCTAAVTWALHGRYLRETVLPVVRGTGVLPPMTEGFRAHVAEPGQVSQLVGTSPGDLQRWLAGQPVASLLVLVATLGTADPPRTTGPDDRRAAARLLRDPSRWQDEAYRRVLDAATGRTLDDIAWAETPERLAAPTARTDAATVDLALHALGRPPGRAALAAALRSDRLALLEALLARGWREPGEPVDTTLGRACRAVIVRDALETGGSLRVSWSGRPTVLDRDGRVLDVDAEVIELLAGTRSDDSPPPDIARIPSPPPRSDVTAPDGRVPGAPPPPAASGPTRHLPIPLMPPFEPDGGGYRVMLQRKVAGSTPLTVTPEGLVLGRHTVEFSAIEHLRVDRSPEELRIELVTASGTVRASHTVAPGSDRSRARIVGDYLWATCGIHVAPRLVDAALAAMRGGDTVRIGSLRMTAGGVAWSRGSPVPWSQVGDPSPGDRRTLQLSIGGDLRSVDLGATDAWLLPTLIPAARRVFGTSGVSR